MKISDFSFDEPELSLKPASSLAAARPEANILDCFDRWVVSQPQALAVVDEETQVTYHELDLEAGRIAAFITKLQFSPETLVGLMIGRSWRFVAAILGVLRAGCAYVPVDPSLPVERRRKLVDSAALPLLISDAPQLRELHFLQWCCASLTHILCVDSQELDSLSESHGSLMSVELWDHLAGDAADDVLAGGWKSAFTGQPIPRQAMAAFGENARRKTAALLTPESRVLEIGCASGFTMRHVAPLCGSYMATDLSRRNVERTEGFAVKTGLTHVFARQLAAHDIDVFAPGSFDLIIFNSVIENFPGFGYLRQVLDKAMTLLAPGGALFAGNIWNLDRRDAYLNDLSSFARAHAGQGYHTRMDFLEDLFVSRAFFEDWATERGGVSVTVSSLEAEGFDPAPYTMDVVLKRGQPPLEQPQKRRHDRRTLEQATGTTLPCVPPQQLAYVLFTSGTSGTPKGVMIEHHSVVNLASAVNSTQLQGKQGGLNISCWVPFSFDASVVQIFTALLNGHSLHLPGEDTRRDPALLHEFFQSRNLALADLTPSMFKLLLDHWENTATSTQAQVIVMGGEVLSAELPSRFYAQSAHRDLRLVNAYGPTETCVSATQYFMTAKSWQQLLPPPIGAPIPGVQVQICDEAGRPLPVGVAGEIRIGGAGVGRAYLHDAQLSAARFVTDAQGNRWYRSGDLGRWLPDAQLQFIGREDRQVKIRGNRIELGEIETALNAQPFVRHSIVAAADPHSQGSVSLAAWLVVQPGFDPAVCRAELDTKLPAYMIPSWLIPVDTIPLNHHGKVDLKPLLRLISDTGLDLKPARPLSTPAEERVAALMGEVLGQSIRDSDADFFALGGHSVLAVRLLALLQQDFGAKIPLTDLFTHSTVARLAERIQHQHLFAPKKTPVVGLNTSGTAIPLICFHPVGGNVLCYQALAEELGSDQPVYMVEAQGLAEGQPPLATVEEMVANYLPAVRELLPSGPVRLAGWSFGGLLAFEAAYRLYRAGVEVREIMLFDALANADGLKALLRKDESEYLALLFEEMGLVDAETLRALTPEERLDLLVERGKGTDLLPLNSDREGMRRLLAVFQNNALAAIRYTPPFLEKTDILLVRPKQLKRLTSGIVGDDYNGWRGKVGGTVHLRWMEGSHGEMLMKPRICQLAAHVKAYLSASGASHSVAAGLPLL